MDDIERLKEELKLQDIEGLIVHEYVRNSKLLDKFINYKLKCILLGCLYFELELSISKDFKQTKTLKIKLSEENLAKELLMCTNYLKRQRNHKLAFTVLKQLAFYVEYRKLILQFLSLELPDQISVTPDEFGGCVVTCEDKSNDFKYFESTWRIKFSCENNEVMDFLDFLVNIRNQNFYTLVTPVMKTLTDPHLSYVGKVREWAQVIEGVRLNSPTHRDNLTGGDTNFSRIYNLKIEAIPIPDDDDDDDSLQLILA